MQLVETIEVGAGGAASIEFTSIPQDADDLLLVVSLRGAIAADSYFLRATFNNDTGSNYTFRRLLGQGSSASSFTSSSVAYMNIGYGSGSTSTSNTFGSSATYITNYTSSTAKSVSVDGVSENNASAANQQLTAGVWTGTAAITSIQIPAFAGDFSQYSTASLYSIKKA